MSMTAEEFKNSLKGIVPVQICPYTEEGEVDIEGLRVNTEFLVDFAKDGDKDVVIMTNGSTTEFFANTIEEQKKIIKTVVDTVAGAIPVVVGVSQAAARQTVQMAKYAEEVGADCAMVVLPYYFVPSEKGMYEYYKAVAESVNIGVMIYNNPYVSGSLIPPDLMARLAEIKNIVAVKDCTPNAIDNALNALTIDPEDMTLINGMGELNYVGSAAYGLRYRGFVSSIANFAPALSYAIYEAVEAGNFNKAFEVLKETFLPLANFESKAQSSRGSLPSWLESNSLFISVLKSEMNLVGLRGGSYSSGELPMEELTDEERKELKGLLEKMGVI